MKNLNWESMFLFFWVKNKKKSLFESWAGSVMEGTENNVSNDEDTIEADSFMKRMCTNNSD